MDLCSLLTGLGVHAMLRRHTLVLSLDAVRSLHTRLSAWNTEDSRVDAVDEALQDLAALCTAHADQAAHSPVFDGIRARLTALAAGSPTAIIDDFCRAAHTDPDRAMEAFASLFAKHALDADSA